LRITQRDRERIDRFAEQARLRPSDWLRRKLDEWLDPEEQAQTQGGSDG
jgi:hypothetical protein